MESLKNFVRYSWNSSSKVRSNVINELIDSLKATDGKMNKRFDFIQRFSFIKIYQILL
jgi:hypothetical protein